MSFFPVFLLDTVSTVLLSTLIPLFVIGLGLGLFFFFRKKFLSGYERMAGEYRTYHDLLTSSSKNMVNRLKALGEYSPSFLSLYQERSKQYDDILQGRDRSLSQSLERLRKMREEKNFKAFKNLASETQIALDDYEKAVSTFNEDLSSLLRDDIDTRESSLASKTMLRRIRDFYASHEDELRPLKESFLALFENAEGIFERFEDDVNQARFKEARALLPQITSVLSAVIAIMDDLPSLVMQVDVVIPQALETMEQDYSAMLKEGYVLDYLNVTETASDIRRGLDDIRNRLCLLDTAGVKNRLEKMQNTIAEIQAKFAEEKRAKQSFLGNQTAFSDASYELEKKYSRCMNQLGEYRKTYVLDRKYVDQMYAIKDDIERIGFLKRDIDSYVDTSERRPYTLITKRIEDMQSEMQKVQRILDDYLFYLDSLKKDSQAIYQGLRDAFLLLKKAERQIREINVPSVTEAYKDRFLSLYAQDAEIDGIILCAPVDVSKAKQLFLPFKDACDAFVRDVEKKYSDCKKAEQSFVYANAFRMEFTDSRPLLVTAEKAFNEGDFDRASDEALRVVRLFSSKNGSKND